MVQIFTIKQYISVVAPVCSRHYSFIDTILSTISLCIIHYIDYIIHSRRHEKVDLCARCKPRPSFIRTSPIKTYFGLQNYFVRCTRVRLQRGVRVWTRVRLSIIDCCDPRVVFYIVN